LFPICFYHKVDVVRNLIVVLFIVVYSLLAVASPVWAAEPPTICDIENVLSGILGFALGFAGLAVFIMFILGAYKWLTAGTNEKAVQQARQTFVYAIMGLAFTMGAWFIFLFIERFTGIDVTVFRIPGCG